MTKFQKVLVAGGDGFLGQNVIKILKEKNINFVSHSISDGYDFRDFKKTNELFEKEKFDAVINCAAFVGGIQFGYEHQGEIVYNNVLMGAFLMEAARINGVKRFVNPISNCVYPAHLTKFKEEELWSGPLHESVAHYGTARKISWVQGLAYKEQYGFDSVHLILPNMYGPMDQFDEIKSHALGAMIMKFVEAKRKNMPEVSVWGTGKPVREWLYVEDGAEILVKALDMSAYSDPINIGRGEGISISDLANLIKEKTGYEGKIFFDSSKPDGVMEKIMDVERMKEVFGWFPKTELKEGVQKTVEYYENNF